MQGEALDVGAVRVECVEQGADVGGAAVGGDADGEALGGVDGGVRGEPEVGVAVAGDEVEAVARVTALDGTGLDAGARISVTLLVAGFVKSDALMMAELAEAVEASGAAPQEAMGQYSRTLRRLVDPAVFPRVAQVIESGVLDQADGPDDEFRFGLARILDGVAALVEGHDA
ncbi:TetR/AcrR family transcriptional regulator C-terminal domain-containing protein [Streptomyces sp. NPDC093105]|uniref:TetR/AcrR family transcriptional regulator C-terminal domain-containing protein n=1 Tax=Streptomyces sp. NPDC093105 TaxID=3366029 RepID=UPI00382FF432